MVSPEASLTPVAAPFLTRISSTSALQRISPPVELDQADEAANERAHAAHGVVHAHLFHERGDHAVDRARPERVAADQQGMEAERRPQALVLEISGDDRVDAAIALEPDEVRGDPRHVHQRVERLVGETLEAEAIDLPALLHESLEPRDVALAELGDLGAHRGGVAALAEHRAVGEADVVEGRDAPEVDVVLHPAPGERPQLLEQERRRDDRRAGVEGEAVLAERGRAAAGGVELFQHRDAVAPRLQPHRRREPAKAAADDDCAGTRFYSRFRTGAISRCQHNLTH